MPSSSYIRRAVFAPMPGILVTSTNVAGSLRLSFAADRSFDEANKIDSLLRDPGVKRDLASRFEQDALAQDDDGPDRSGEDHGA